MKKILIFIFAIYSLTLKAQDFGGSGWCQDDENVNCSKWWTSLNDNKRAVFLIEWPSGATCTGTLINQIVEDGEIQQLFVTAKHCTNDEDFTQECNLYFNYQSPSCDNNDVPAGNQNGNRYRLRTLVTLLDDISVFDVSILRIESPIPPHFNVYYAGWTLSNLQVTQLPHHVIHHPSGDIKKIAKTFGTVTSTNYACHTITTVIDAVFSWFGVRVNTERVCTFIELPHYSVSAWWDGVTEPGSSGSALLNSNGRIIGILSWGLGSCSFRAVDQFGRFNSAYTSSRTMRNALNPDGDYILTGISGRQIDCHDDLLNLSGDYFPASDYQPDNQIVMKANNNITTSGNLTIHSGADFVFEAGNSITFGPGFRVEAGATFSARTGTSCNSNLKSGEVGVKDIIASIPIPDYKAFGTNNLKSGKVTGIEYYSDEKEFISIYPNPVNDIAKIDLGFSDLQSVVNIEIFNSIGTRIIHKQLNNVLNTKVELNLSSLMTGVYMVKISNDTKTVTKKIIKE